ncbi:hypothetical protein GCM10010442_70360 [Kitasatospora kifunensis]
MVPEESYDLEVEAPAYVVWGSPYDEEVLGEIADDWSPYLVPDARVVEVATHTQWSTVHLVLQRLDGAPPVDLDGWDDAHEVSLLASPRTDPVPENPDHILISSRGEGDDCADFDELECPGGVDTWWRMRVHRRVGSAGEEHLIQAWIAERQPVVQLSR